MKSSTGSACCASCSNTIATGSAALCASGCGRVVVVGTNQADDSLQLESLLTPSPTTWYILQCGIHRITGIYSQSPSASGCVRRIRRDTLVQNMYFSHTPRVKTRLWEQIFQEFVTTHLTVPDSKSKAADIRTGRNCNHGRLRSHAFIERAQSISPNFSPSRKSAPDKALT